MHAEIQMFDSTPVGCFDVLSSLRFSYESQRFSRFIGFKEMFLQCYENDSFWSVDRVTWLKRVRETCNY